MAELKTKATAASVTKFLESVKDDGVRADCLALVKLLSAVTMAEPKMWGASIVGFGDMRYVYASGREGDWFLAGFSPRKQNLTIYVMAGFDDPAMEKLGKYTTGKGCLYVKRLSDLHMPSLKKLVQGSVAKLRKASKAVDAKRKKK